MEYYAIITDNMINGKGQCPCTGDNTFSVEITEEVYNDLDKYIYSEGQVILNPNYEQEQAEKERQRLDSLTLTPADVERALYKAKGMDFDDLKALIVQALPTVDIKGLAIEFRAKDFFRGATANGMRLFDVVGQLLGYTSDDMDYLFINKELPTNEGVNNNAN